MMCRVPLETPFECTQHAAGCCVVCNFAGISAPDFKVCHAGRWRSTSTVSLATHGLLVMELCGRCVPCISGISNAAGFMWKRERRTSTPGTQSFDRISRPGLLRGNMERQETRGGSTHPVATSRTGMRGLRRVSATLSALGSGALSRNLRHLGPSWRLPPSPWPTFEL